MVAVVVVVAVLIGVAVGLTRRRRQGSLAAGQASRTGEVVALLRAEIDRPHSAQGDPDAQARLCRGMRPAGSTTIRSQMLARTRFFDGQVQDALASGIDQIVVCGASYDDRALRFRTTGVRFFELDHPSTQPAKVARLQAGECDTTGLALAPADFGRDDVAAALRAVGHSADRPTAYLCEGLLVYLDPATIHRLLSGLAACAAPGSRLAASLAVHREDRDSRDVVRAANARRAHGASEPWVTILPASEHLPLLERAGWSVTGSTDGAALSPEQPPGRMLLVTASR
ncbi:MAG TPA: SAM-dependent methyltransferase [Acidimicrobiales bacterium]|nr:SAM-dependent methyltransferase [Acidimicrobiales bacterium]